MRLAKLFVIIELVFQLSEKGQVVADRGRSGKYRCIGSHRRSAGRESRLEAKSGAQGIKNYTGCISDFVLHYILCLDCVCAKLDNMLVICLL